MIAIPICPKVKLVPTTAGLQMVQQLVLHPILVSLSQRTAIHTTETGTETEIDPSITETETGTVTVTVTTHLKTETEILGTDAPSILVVLTDEAMLRDHLLSFAITSPPMVLIMCPLPAAMIPTIGVVASVMRRWTTGPSHRRSMTEGLHTTTVIHHFPLLLLTTVVWLWMVAR